MNRDQDNFFDEEPKAADSGNAAGQEGYQDDGFSPGVEDDHTHLMTLLSYLQDAVEHASVVPLTGKRLVDTEMCLTIINDIRGNLPLAIQYAEQVVRDRENILVSARRYGQQAAIGGRAGQRGHRRRGPAQPADAGGGSPEPGG